MASNSSVATDGTEDACWGPPQTRNLGPCWPEVVASLCSLFSVSLAPVLSFCPVRHSPADNQCLLSPCWLPAYPAVLFGTLHRASVSAPPASGFPPLVRPSSGASPRQADASSQPVPPGKAQCRKRFIIDRIAKLQLLWDTSDTWSNSLHIWFSDSQKLCFNLSASVAFGVPDYSKVSHWRIWIKCK